ncbi:F-box/FBD/LRR-repeat protein [Hibiscus syriacus]|uniref:F-box/FBD/LRR-repeat protein n=1 Tax=Hibiscus syriacus TaxID=106335 RepID=A0A6A2XC93_HIBSY|nr:F-box/FBD/LRR-repeat protein [Hibiscus syriacus]
MRASADRVALRNRHLKRNSGMSRSYSTQREKNMSNFAGYDVNSRRFGERNPESALANEGVIAQLSEQISSLNDRMDEFTTRNEELNSKLAVKNPTSSQQNLAFQAESCNVSAPTSHFINGLGNGSIMLNSLSSSQLAKDSPIMEEFLNYTRYEFESPGSVFTILSFKRSSRCRMTIAYKTISRSISSVARGQRQIMHQLDNLSNFLHERTGEKSQLDQDPIEMGDVLAPDLISDLPQSIVEVEDSLVKFITRTLFLHQGPIHKFQLTTSHLQCCPDIDQWLLFLSRNDIKELVLELGEGEWFRVPSCLFNCKKLTRLVSPEAIESLISSCPLLESLALSYFDSLALTIRAPNLKYLCLEGEFKDICLENTPLLVAMSVAVYMTDDIAEHFEQSSSCNFNRFLGSVPRLERLIGHIYFTKFEDMKEVLVVLHLITNSPNLRELQISGSSNTLAAIDAPDLDFWDDELPSDCTFKQLKLVKMTDMSGVPHEMEFIKFLLTNSPALETMSISPCVYVMDGRLNMLIELLSFRRASAQAEILFIQD